VPLRKLPNNPLVISLYRTQHPLESLDTMLEQRNIVIVGGSTSGLLTAHNVLRHILPELKAKASAKYHVYLINPSSSWYFRNASPRVAASTTRMAAEQILFEIKDGFKQYSADDFTFVEATATGLDTTARTLSYKNRKTQDNERLSYHALVVATGSSTYFQAFSQSAGTQEVLDSIKTTNEKIQSAKDIIIVGGGPTALEFAAEVAEHRNGKPGWFSNSKRNLNITLITATDRILTPLRPALGKIAAQKLEALGVDIVYNTRVVDAKENTTTGRTTVTLAKGEALEADFYVPAYGVEPNSSWLPSNLLDEKKYVQTAPTLRVVNAAGPRVYALGDVASYSRNTGLDVINSLPVLAVNMKRDLLSFDSSHPDAKPKGKDRVYIQDTRETMVVPLGTGGGVGVAFGWKLPSWVAWYLKGRDFFVAQAGLPMIMGNMSKETVWTKQEAAI
jgi:NADH dehydrogenase FAD-containing subunit